MNAACAEQFRILIVGDVITDTAPSHLHIARQRSCVGMDKERWQFGGAANIAQIAAGLGVMVGLLLLNPDSDELRLRQIAHFHLLLPQYDVIVFSEYGNCAVDDLDDMVSAARHLGKRVLVDLDGNRFGASTGASLMISSAFTLRRMIGAWHHPGQLAAKLEKLLSDFKCDAFLVNRHDAGVSMYLPGNMINFAGLVRCDKYYLLAAVAANLKAGISMPAAVSEASGKYHPMVADFRDDIFCQEMVPS